MKIRLRKGLNTWYDPKYGKKTNGDRLMSYIDDNIQGYIDKRSGKLKEDVIIVLEIKDIKTNKHKELRKNNTFPK